jgi:phage/plasmid-like protein (TIGR03299 family)
MSDPRGTITIMTTALDRTEAFNAERAGLIQSLRDGQASAVARAEEYNKGIDAKIKDGRLVSLGNDRYQVVDPGSWDNGEVWTYRKVSTQAPALLLPEHGLAELEDGSVALYRKRPAWHNLGNFHLEGLTDISQVLKESGLDYEVAQIPNRYTWKGVQHTVPGEFINVREDTGEPFKTVGKVYTPVQNRQAFEFLQALADKGDIEWETAGQTAKGRVFVTMRLPDTLIVDEGGLNDEIVPFVGAFNSHDGQTPFQVVTTPWAPICGNTERFALRDAVTKWTIRHTESATRKIEDARKTLGLSLKYYEQLGEEETQLARNAMLIDEFRALTAELWPLKEGDPEEETTRSKNFRERRDDQLEELWGKNSNRAGKTAYAGERAITEYLDHVAPRRAVGDKLAAARATAILEGTDDGIKAKAHEKLMLRVR